MSVEGKQIHEPWKFSHLRICISAHTIIISSNHLITRNAVTQNKTQNKPQNHNNNTICPTPYTPNGSFHQNIISTSPRNSMRCDCYTLPACLPTCSLHLPRYVGKYTVCVICTYEPTYMHISLHISSPSLPPPPSFPPSLPPSPSLPPPLLYFLPPPLTNRLDSTHPYIHTSIYAYIIIKYTNHPITQPTFAHSTR